eukprot:s530_g12.t2
MAMMRLCVACFFSWISSGLAASSRPGVVNAQHPDPSFVANLVAYHTEVLETAVAQLSSGKPFADWIFNNDTASFPKTRALEDKAQVQQSLKEALQSLVTCVQRLSLGKALADHVFQTDTGQLLEPKIPTRSASTPSRYAMSSRYAAKVAALEPRQVSVLLEKENEMLAIGISKLSAGKPLADYIFGMDTGELPREVPSEMYLQRFIEDRSLAQHTLNATNAMLARAASGLSAGKALADAVFGSDTSHLLSPLP